MSQTQHISHGARSCERLSICFVVHNGYRALSGKRVGHIGGVERQQSIMSKWLAARGHAISMITWDEGQEEVNSVIAGVRVIKLCQKDSGVRGLRFVHPRWTSLLRALRQADADVYYQNSAESVTGQVALWCRMHKRKFVYSVANDPDCDPRLPELRHLHERVLYRYGVRKSDTVIVQTLRQRMAMARGFKRESVVLPMPCYGPSDQQPAPRTFPSKRPYRIIWVGRICEQKRPDVYLDLAKARPDLILDLVGPVGDTPYARGIVETAKRIPNVNVHGSVPRQAMPGIYRSEIVCLCCTSDFEGFPNTFLEAWSLGLPIVSTFDPDGLIEKRRLGLTASDLSGLAEGIDRLISSPSLFREISDNALAYYRENHTVETAMPRFESVFRLVVNGGPSGDLRRRG
ncbi:MAG: glycosyltransferase family 4 protein [Phycisphaerae bacterium]